MGLGEILRYITIFSPLIILWTLTTIEQVNSKWDSKERRYSQKYRDLFVKYEKRSFKKFLYLLLNTVILFFIYFIIYFVYYFSGNYESVFISPLVLFFLISIFPFPFTAAISIYRRSKMSRNLRQLRREEWASYDDETRKILRKERLNNFLFNILALILMILVAIVMHHIQGRS